MIKKKEEEFKKKLPAKIEKENYPTFHSQNISNSSNELPPSPPPPPQTALHFSNPPAVPPLTPNSLKKLQKIHFSSIANHSETNVFTSPASSVISDSSLFASSKHIAEDFEEPDETEEIIEKRFSKAYLDESLKNHAKSEGQLLSNMIQQECQIEKKKFTCNQENITICSQTNISAEIHVSKITMKSPNLKSTVIVCEKELPFSPPTTETKMVEKKKLTIKQEKFSPNKLTKIKTTKEEEQKLNVENKINVQINGGEKFKVKQKKTDLQNKEEKTNLQSKEEQFRIERKEIIIDIKSEKENIQNKEEKVCKIKIQENKTKPMKKSEEKVNVKKNFVKKSNKVNLEKKNKFNEQKSFFSKEGISEKEDQPSPSPSPSSSSSSFCEKSHTPPEEEKIIIEIGVENKHKKYENQIKDSISNIFENVPSKTQDQLDFIYNSIPMISKLKKVESPKLKPEKKKIEKIKKKKNSKKKKIMYKSLPLITSQGLHEFNLDDESSTGAASLSSGEISFSSLSSSSSSSAFSNTIKLQKDFDAFLNGQNKINVHLQKMQEDYCQQLEILESTSSVDLNSNCSQSDENNLEESSSWDSPEPEAKLEVEVEKNDRIYVIEKNLNTNKLELKEKKNKIAEKEIVKKTKSTENVDKNIFSSSSEIESTTPIEQNSITNTNTIPQTPSSKKEKIINQIQRKKTIITIITSPKFQKKKITNICVKSPIKRTNSNRIIMPKESELDLAILEIEEMLKTISDSESENLKNNRDTVVTTESYTKTSVLSYKTLVGSEEESSSSEIEDTIHVQLYTPVTLKPEIKTNNDDNEDINDVDVNNSNNEEEGEIIQKEEDLPKHSSKDQIILTPTNSEAKIDITNVILNLPIPEDTKKEDNKQYVKELNDVSIREPEVLTFFENMYIDGLQQSKSYEIQPLIQFSNVNVEMKTNFIKQSIENQSPNLEFLVDPNSIKYEEE